jgi:hypothetical protein
MRSMRRVFIGEYRVLMSVIDAMAKRAGGEEVGYPS